MRSRTEVILRWRRRRISSSASKRENAATSSTTTEWAPQPLQVDQDGVVPTCCGCGHRGQTRRAGHGMPADQYDIRVSRPGSKIEGSTLTPRSANLSVN